MSLHKFKPAEFHQSVARTKLSTFFPHKLACHTRKTVAALMSLTYVPTLNDRYFEVGHLYFSTKSNLELFGNHLIMSYRFVDV